MEHVRLLAIYLHPCRWRWEDHIAMNESEERAAIARAVRSLVATTGAAPLGWYCRTASSLNTRRLLVEHGGFAYDSDAYNDDLPYVKSRHITSRHVASHRYLSLSLSLSRARSLSLLRALSLSSHPVLFKWIVDLYSAATQ
jgi:hypothetical protein